MEADERWPTDGGWAMVSLLVALTVMAIMLTVAVPSWTTFVRREREAELVFRGEQYARAIAMFQRKYGNAIPPNLDVLVNEKLLRKKYKDPITGEDFQVLSPGQPIPGQDSAPAALRGSGVAQGAIDAARAAGALQAARTRTATPLGGSVIGVVSKSTDRSLRLYNGRDKYNEWVFLGTQQSTRAGGPGGAPGGRGGQFPGRGGPNVPGGRGASPGGPIQPPGAGGRQLTLPPGARGGFTTTPGRGVQQFEVGPDGMVRPGAPAGRGGQPR